MIISWHEHLTENEQPPVWMWTLSEELERHFERIKERREAGTTNDDDDESGLVIHNEYAKGRGRSMR
jgi:hypothetical protein